MAGGSFFALFDDIATLLDDVAAMTKVAAQKTAGVLGDDLALNANQVAGVRAERELPVVWAVAKGSLINKLILVPLALLISYAAPFLIMPMLMLGGAYLCFEGIEKVVHAIFHQKDAQKHHAELVDALDHTSQDPIAYEKDKIRGAIRTDFILSAEIIVIALGTVTEASLMNKSLVLSLVAVAMTIGVYGIVGIIVKLDDVGFFLLKTGKGGVIQVLGQFLIRLAPKLMKALSVLGTLAMFLVGGGIIVHGWPILRHAVENITQRTSTWPLLGNLVEPLIQTLLNMAVGIILGACVLVVVHAIQTLRQKS